MAADEAVAEPPTTTTTTTTTPKAGRSSYGSRPQRVEKHHVGGFLILLSILDLIVLGLAGWALNKVFDGGITMNAATFALALTALIAGMVTLAAILAGLMHVKHNNSGSVSGASGIALVAWALTMLAFGIACKQANIGGVGSRLKALEAFVIILAFFETLYVLMIHAGLFNSRYGASY